MVLAGARSALAWFIIDTAFSALYDVTINARNVSSWLTSRWRHTTIQAGLCLRVQPLA